MNSQTQKKIKISKLPGAKNTERVNESHKVKGHYLHDPGTVPGERVSSVYNVSVASKRAQ